MLLSTHVITILSFVRTTQIDLWIEIRRSRNIALHTLSGVNYHERLAICSKYDINVSYM